MFWTTRAAALGAALTSAMLLSAIASEYPALVGPKYLPMSLALLATITLLHEMHIGHWPIYSRVGFPVIMVAIIVIVVTGLIGDVAPSARVVAWADAGWWLLGGGLVLAGGGAVSEKLSRPATFLVLPGLLLLLRIPAKWIWGGYVGGMVMFVMFAMAWLVLATFLISFDGDEIRRNESGEG